MQYHRNRRVLLFCRMVTAFEAACGAGEDDFGHCWVLGEINRPCAGSSGAFADKTSQEIKGLIRAPVGFKQTALGETGGRVLA
jgi:hypothetical protein